ncbi:hypothetical protein DWQ67_02615 [Galactobacter caseinivorans]|uniref:Calcineurin-like phosphoesterase domain-containing protein n=1 Tax=Galactobacter caseinivorans TaxID=2676123 RepID=A0A496PMH8_9MICC|nr:hypothetical protein DWQ67_02615 [Galactobacter caseinivorans]
MTVPALSDQYVPDLRSSATVQVFADNQFGAFSGHSTNWNMRAATDSLSLKPYVGMRANAGDCIEWNTATPEDADYKAFRNVLTGDGLPYLDVPGNHDLTTYNNAAKFPYTRTTADGIFERMARTADEWARDVPARGSANAVASTSDIAVMGVSSDLWAYRPNIASPNYAPPDPLTEATLTWMDQQLTALGSKPTWLMSHQLPLGQFASNPGGVDEYLRPWSRIAEVLDAHPNVLGWISGHWHIDPARADGVAKINVGSRSITAINAPSSQGLRSGWNAKQLQYGDGTLGPEYAKSMFIGYDGTDITLRWRNHNNGTWVQPQGGKYRRITL